MLLISDGRLRKIGRPKKKNMKHLVFADASLAGTRDALLGGGRPTDRQLRGELAKISDFQGGGGKERGCEHA
jgi:hypothetical protein